MECIALHHTPILMSQHLVLKMQLDVDRSSFAKSTILGLTLICMTFDPCDL